MHKLKHFKKHFGKNLNDYDFKFDGVTTASADIDLAYIFDDTIMLKKKKTKSIFDTLVYEYIVSGLYSDEESLLNVVDYELNYEFCFKLCERLNEGLGKDSGTFWFTKCVIETDYLIKNYDSSKELLRKDLLTNSDDDSLVLMDLIDLLPKNSKYLKSLFVDCANKYDEIDFFLEKIDYKRKK